MKKQETNQKEIRNKEKAESKTDAPRWTARRIVALIGIILLLALYGSTMVFALIGSQNAKAWLMASIYCTIAVPILLYAMTLTARNLRGKGTNPEIRDAYEKVKKEQQAKEKDANSKQ